MALLPDLGDPTLAAIDRELELRAGAEPRRSYLGASLIGHECWRYIWYAIRPEVPRADFDAATLRRFADGHRTEDLFFERLRLVPGLEVHTHDAEGRQYGFSDLAGRFKGSVDGVVRGLLQAPKTWHVAEVKCVNEKSFAAFNKLRATQGEKQTLNLWNTRYWAQAQVYMHMLGLTRHWLVALTPGGRDHTSCRTEYDPSASQALVNKAEMILRADEPPARLSEHKTSYKCKYCDFSEVCHGDR